jgi:inorganic pyrophosphatase
VPSLGSIGVADPSSHAAPCSPPGPRAFLPTDAPAQLDRFPLLLALLEQALDGRADDHHEDEEDEDPKRGERDLLVVGLAGQALAVVGGEGGGREQEGEGSGREDESHAKGNDTLPPVADDDSFACIVEIPKGSRNKYEWDHERDRLVLDRFLFSSVVYPTDYGFIPDTLSLDGDPLDVMICVSEPTFPGCMIDVKPIALFRMEDDQGIDDKILCVPLKDPGWNKMEKLDDLPQQLRDEIAHFFSIYKDLERKRVKVDGWYSREDADEEIAASRERFRKNGDHSQ